MGEVLWELLGEDTNEHGLPRGFRFHPTDEELVTFYLAAKVLNGGFTGLEMVEIDLNRCEPWELPDIAKLGEREWYFYSLRDRKYPTGLRTNRATGAGYWKATGKDKEVYSASSGVLVGMKKTLVFYKGRAPRGEKTKWVLHEYRLEGDFFCRHSCKEEWVICRIFHKTGGDRKSPFFQNDGSFLEHSPSSSSTQLLTYAPLAEMQTLESPFQFLLQDHRDYTSHQDTHHQVHPHLLPPVSLPQSFQLTNISSVQKPDFHHRLHKESSSVSQHCGSSVPTPAAQAFFNLVDENPENPFAFGMLPGLLGLSFGDEAVHDLPSWLAGATSLAESGPSAPWDCSHSQVWQL